MAALVCVKDYAEKAKEIISKSALDYYISGAGDEFTLRLNSLAFQQYRIRPRFLRDVSERSTECKVLDFNLKIPIGISPTAMQKMAHPDGEKATARAAGEAGTIFILSTIATSSIEEVAEAAPNTIKWFQLYIYKDREITKSLIRRAEVAGFKAIVLTVDAPFFGLRRADARNKFMLPPHLILANFVGDKTIVRSGQGSGINEYVTSQFDQTISWKDVNWLVSFTKLPVILKGVLTREDALLALNTGCKGIIVSNHGGRQIDCVPASIEALPEIVRAVGDKLVIMMDGGVYEGTDVYKALALGAKFVFFGRPAIWGLAVNGQQGVTDILNILKKELDLAMALSGVCNISEITREFVVPDIYYKSVL